MWKLILNAAIGIVMYFFNRHQKKSEARKQFLEFVETMNEQSLVSVRLNAEDRIQVKELRARRKFLEGTFNKKVVKMQKARRRAKETI